ncbi:MAG: cation-transporting P-type ATPase [Candidatus Margulisbacteria bacterium]|nr:cation-transporting P-type ATPase [Candidatus Margulisiibacteriota bacterium]
MSIANLAREQVFEELKTSAAGLTDAEAAVRLKKYGRNEIRELAGTPLVLKFLANLYQFFALLLWVAAAMAYLGGMPELAVAIACVVLINAVFSFWQEYRAERAIAALKKLLPSYAKVIRDGREKRILSAELAPGDLLVLEAGDNISADARLIEEFELRTNNSTLTGESAPAVSTADPVPEEKRHLTEYPNLVFAGTSVVFGTGKAVVFAAGMRSEFGQIAHLTQTVKTEPSPLQKELGHVTGIVTVFSVTLGVVFYFLGTGLGHLAPLQGFLFMVGIIVANVPEGLLPTLSLSLAMGAQRMAKRKALIKKLSSVETLGSTDVILTDKTGTLTTNTMEVKKVWTGSPARLDLAGVLANNAKLSADGSVIGDPTEGALLTYARKAGTDPLAAAAANPRLYLLPFESRRKRMTSINRDQAGNVAAFVKGAPKEMLALCRKIEVNGQVKELDEDRRREIISIIDGYAGEALRVLAIAYRPLPAGLKEYTVENVEQGLIFLGLAAMTDPPRPEAAAAVKKCEQAGIRVIMITGDYSLTAEAVARQTGIIKGECRVIEGEELDNLSHEALIREINEKEVLFARVNPGHKLKVVSALKAAGKIVAVTGDGVNDAPALKKADIGVAMGVAGTDVAKEAAEIVLLDDNFATIVNAIEEGRTVYENIKKFVTYIFTSNVPEIIPFILFVLFKIPLPLTIMQILAVDLGTDIMPALALGSEQPEPDIMRRPPRPAKKRLLDLPLLARAYGWLGLLEGAAAMAGFYFVYFSAGWRPGSPMAASGPLYLAATTMCLAAIVTSQIGNGFACRSERSSTFSIGFFGNRFFLFGVLAELVIINLLIYFPPLAKVFGLFPIGPVNWAFLLLFTPAVFLAEELRKLVFRTWLYGKRPNP